MRDLFIGLMSGTSLDGVDGVLVDFASGRLQVLAHEGAPFSPDLRHELLALNTAGANELHRASLAANAVMRVYAQVVRAMLQRTRIDPDDVVAIGAHGQTVRHRPREFDGTGYTIQLCNGALLAELAGIDVACDFRSRDVAAGGQGAPLAPFFHGAMFARPGEAVGVLNIGGIANLTLLRADGTQLGFDCGPGNSLMDLWCERHQGKEYDEGGAWAAAGDVDKPLLNSLLSDPFFRKRPPKSTGRDLFNAAWLDAHLVAANAISRVDVQATLEIARVDVQATLAELTAVACASDVQLYEPHLKRLIVCGGGALNTHLMSRLQALLPGTRVVESSAVGLPALQVEACAFAWLARHCVHREALDLKSTTGARGARVLGAVYPR
jgi:anhydro-N-acetylmuramic acid kinase